MNIYEINVIETLIKTVEAQADSPTAAIQKVKDLYWQDEIHLTSDDYTDVRFETDDGMYADDYI